MHCWCLNADADAGVECCWKPAGRPKMLKLTARKPERTLEVLPKDCHETPEGPPPRIPKEELPEYLLPRKVPVSQLELPPGRQDDFRLLPPRHRGRPQNTHLGLGLGAGTKIHIWGLGGWGLGLGHELRDSQSCNNGSRRPTGWLPNMKTRNTLVEKDNTF